MVADPSYLVQFEDEADFYNSIVLDNLLPVSVQWQGLPRPVRSWIRNYIGGVILYLLSGIFWSFFIYILRRNVYISKGRFVCLFVYLIYY